ncbi:DUF4440 domain-containing protein [Thalassotalea sp. PLHSN55]|uniref:DUF4440 domain-containing protein n=1 Tax=Thalassotalea sp. PLHSN55 TaxID=3435888 RepID=UPI003F82418F
MALTTEINQLMSTWAQGFSEETPEAICRLYAENASLWGTFSPIQRNTTALIEQYFTYFFQFSERKIEFDQFEIRCFDNFAISNGIYTFSWFDKNHKVITQARFSFVYQKIGGSWLIVDHHSSILPPF